MPSLRARILSAWIRAIVRRRDWGSEDQLTRRARKLFGYPGPLQRLHTGGIKVTPVAESAVNGEWVVPQRVKPGLILYMHGGGYVSCSAATHRPITAALARLTGRRVFSLDYRLAPEHRFPAALDDAVAAYRWILENQAIDPTELAVAGDSAGGGLTLALLVKVRELGLPMPACAVCFSAWTDLAGMGQSLKDNANLDAMFRPENISDFARAYLGTASARDPLASPVYASLEGLPPLLLHVGSTEILLDDSRRVHEAIVQAGGTTHLKVFDDVSHGWQVLKGIVPEAAQSLSDAAAFIDEAMTRAAAPASALNSLRA
jgi:acetyl esterase/lipase